MTAFSLRLGSLNVNGCKDAFRIHQVLSFCLKEKLGVTFLQETHTTQEIASRWERQWEGSAFFSHLTDTSCGVAILFSSCVKPEILVVNEVSLGRLLHVKVRFEDFVVNFVNIYAPCWGAARVRFYDHMRRFMLTLPDEECVILGGDFNCTLNPSLDRVGKEPHSPSTKELQQVVKLLNLRDIWRVQHPTDKSFTYTSIRGGHISQSRLDRFYLSHRWCRSVIYSGIKLAHFTDHNLVWIKLSLAETRRGKGFWHFNNALVQDEAFLLIFRNFWQAWRDRKGDFCSLGLWWDVGKARLKLLCQEYSYGWSATIGVEIAKLEEELLHLESRLTTLTPAELHTYEKKKSTLKACSHVKAQGAFVRSRLQFLLEDEYALNYLKALEKRKGRLRTISSVLAEDGSLLNDSESIHERIRVFYAKLYSGTKVDVDACSILWNSLPEATTEDRERLEAPFSLEELTIALHSLSLNKSPGVDGLSCEFYNKVWDLIGLDYLSVAQEACTSGQMPLTWRRATLALIPKEGDLRDMKNYRPVSLSCVDYKIMAKMLSNRLGPVLSKLVNPDQSYAIPGRTIHDNIFLVRDLIQYAEKTQTKVGFLSLDQEKAFDQMNHDYLFETLLTFGLGRRYVGMIQTLYTSAECLIKVNGHLLAPFSSERGIRQGCPLSGQLYSLCIEPFLCLMRRRLTGIVVPNNRASLILSAYADDILVFASSARDMQAVYDCQQVYSAASSATINWRKSSGLLIGPIQITEFPTLFQELTWSRNELKYLGVHLSTSSGCSPIDNWRTLGDKIEAKLRDWSGLLKVLSLRGKTLLIKKFIIPKLIFKISCVSIPEEFLVRMQRKLLDYFWNGKHWVSLGILSLPFIEGGQSFPCLRSHYHASRLKTIQRYLYMKPAPQWCSLASYFFSKVQNLRYKKYIFAITSHNLSSSETLPLFYQEMLKAWNAVDIKRTDLYPSNEMFEEPLFFNPLLQGPTLASFSLRKKLLTGNISMVGDLLNDRKRGLLLPEELAAKMGLRTIRIPSRILQEVKMSLPPDCLAYLENPNDGEATLQISINNFVDFKIGPRNRELPQTPPSHNMGRPSGAAKMSFCGLSRKNMYLLVIHSLHYIALVTRWDTPWREILPHPIPSRPCWGSLYLYPTPRTMADLSWRLLHGALSSGAMMRHFTNIPEECCFCGERETIFHMYLQCRNLQPIFLLIKNLLLRFWLHFSPTLFIIGHPVKEQSKSRDLLVNFILTCAKMAIYKTRKAKIERNMVEHSSVGLICLLRSRITSEYKAAEYCNTVQKFKEIWTTNEALCSITPQGTLLLFV